MVIVLLHNEAGGVQIVYPGGDLLIIGALSGDGVDQYRAVDVGTAEQADGLYHPGSDPPRLAVFVDLELRRGKQEGGVLEAQVPGDVAVKRLGEGILHSFRQADYRGLLGDHIHHHIGGQAFGAVGEPLDDVRVVDGSHPHGTALVVDLGRVVGILELTDHIAERTHLAVPQKLRGGAVQRGNLVKRDLSHIGGEIAVLHVQQIPVGARTEDGEGDDGAYDGHQDQRQKQDADRQALGLDELEILFGTAAAQVEPGGDQGADHVDHAEDADEQVKVAGLEIDGGLRKNRGTRPQR